ncbi:MAG: beta-lactamase family protein, partial [Candidatus Phytoplasma sp.]|nr:beta-lactamase family protein [Phytoplasma sp.]
DILKTNGLGIIDEHYMKEAKSFQSDTRYTTDGFDFTYGYGYQTWLNSKNGFTMYGMGGQLVYYDQDNDITLITVSNLTNIPNGTQMLLNLYHQYIGNNASLINENEFYAYQGKKIKPIHQQGLNFYQTYETKDQDKISLSISQDQGYLTIKDQKIRFSLHDQIEDEFPNTKEKYIAQAIVKPNKLYITLYLISEELGTLYMDVSYDLKTIVIVSKGFSENYLKEWNFNIKGEKV